MSLQYWLPLISNTNNQGLTGVAVNAYNATTFSDSLFKTGLKFNGSSTYLQGTVYTTANMTYMMWLYFDSATGCHVIDCRNASGAGYQPMYINPSTGVQVGGSTSTFPYIPYVFTANIWYHVAVTYSPTKCQLFINGSLVGENTSAKGTSINANMPFYIGSRYTQANWFNGRMNDLRIYDHTCSAKEIAEIAKGLYIHYKLNESELEGTINYIPFQSDFASWRSYGFGSHGVKTAKTGNTPNNTQAICAVTSDSSTLIRTEMAIGLYSVPALSTNESATFSAYVRGVGSTIGTTGFLHVYNSNGTDTQSNGVASFTFTENWQRIDGQFIWIKTANSSTTYNVYIVADNLDNTRTFEFCEPQFEIKNHVTAYTKTSRTATTTVTDCSGFKNNGQIVGNLISNNSSPRYDKSVTSSAGAANYIASLESLSPNCKTVSFWVNMNFNSNQTVFADKSNYWALFYYQSRDRFLVGTGAGDENHYTFPRTAMIEGWNHIAIVREGTYTKHLFINGEEIDPDTSYSDYYTQNAGLLNIFRRNYNDAPAATNMSLSDFRIYLTALTAKSIKELYNESVAIDKNNNIHSREFVESTTGISIKETGQLLSNSFQEDATNTFFTKTGTIKCKELYEY